MQSINLWSISKKNSLYYMFYSKMQQLNVILSNFQRCVIKCLNYQSWHCKPPHFRWPHSRLHTILQRMVSWEAVVQRYTCGSRSGMPCFNLPVILYYNTVWTRNTGILNPSAGTFWLVEAVDGMGSDCESSKRHL